MPSAQTVAPTSRAKRTNDSTSAIRAGSAWMSRDQVAVELDDVGLHPHQLLEPGVAGAGVVDRDLGAALAQVGDRSASESSSGTNSCSVISITIPSRSPRRARLDDVGSQRRGADVDRQVGAERAAERLERGSDRRRLELGAEAAAVRLGEPDIR